MVLDSSALLAYLHQEPGGLQVRPWLPFAFMSTVISKFQGRQRARAVVAQLLALFSVAEINAVVLHQAVFSVAEVNAVVLHQAVNSDFSDFEDAVLYQAGVFMNVDGLVTRNQKDFKSATLPVYTPDELLAILPRS